MPRQRHHKKPGATPQIVDMRPRRVRAGYTPPPTPLGVAPGEVLPAGRRLTRRSGWLRRAPVYKGFGFAPLQDDPMRLF